jgi:lysophosphatidylcholine acyltransferase/lyso-PAF acetyltransferase
MFFKGNLTRLCQPIIVDREKHSSRSDSLKEIVERVSSGAKWPPMSLYTEGTCTNRKALIMFKTGAFVAGLPVQPVCLKYKGLTLNNSWTWDGPSLFQVFWITLCQFHITAEFHFLPVYHPNEQEKNNSELYAENVRKVMAEYLKVPISDYSYDDGRLVAKAKQFKLPSEFGFIKIHNLRKKIGLAALSFI